MVAVAGRKVVVTGKIEGESRQSAESKLRDAGAHVQSSVTRDTDVLVTGGNVGATKLNAARKHGAEIVRWHELWGSPAPPRPETSASPYTLPPKPPAASRPDRQIAPMLAQAGDLVPGDGWLYEIKWDGHRSVAVVDEHGCTLWSRAGNEQTDTYPAVAAELHANIAGLAGNMLRYRGRWIFDGELVVLDDQGRSDVHALGAGRPVQYVVFDVLEAAGEDVRNQPLEARQELLKDVIAGGPGPLVGSSPVFDDGDLLLDHARKQGLEGIVAKRKSSKYVEGKRSPSWLKLKIRCEQEFVVCGWKPGNGALSDRHGTLVLAVNGDDGEGLVYVGHSGGGGNVAEGNRVFERLLRLETDECPIAVLGAEDAKQLKRERIRWVKPELVAQVAFQRWTPDGHLWHPTFKGLRDDKAASEVRREPCGVGS